MQLSYQIIAPFLSGHRSRVSLPASVIQVLHFVLDTSPPHKANPFTRFRPWPIEPSPKPVGGTLADKRSSKSFKLPR